MRDAAASHGPGLQAAAGLLRLLGHPVRLGIALLLLDGPQTVSDMERRLALKQPNLSQHLAILRDAGVVSATRAAKSVTYALAAGAPRHVLRALAADAPASAAGAVGAVGAVGAALPRAAAASPAHAPAAAGASPSPRPHGRDDGDALVFATVRFPAGSGG